ncbi:BREX-1 system adenine-specific DNA-methyltransferase PglX [uncultured Slackia sp.]|uniref:BREX-1 system adenine-specific DNA-methyltransferase PglX n=1 Tax=uncultured Slackia sp. TaxID=665903 RepID=UPI002674B618|nr:BREX-1 system adenine-specific DNA-methyltransferase PglX [uncultured Slackia sp.]
MNDSAIKTFCVQAREKLEQGVELRMQKYGIAAESVPNAAADAVGALPLSPIEREQRAELLQLQAKLGEGDAAHGNARLKERAAYTWFNRMVAIRFMELRDFLPSRVRMFSRSDGSFGSQAVDEALDLEIEGLNAARVLQLKQASDDEALFRYLFLAQCQELASCIPNVFEPVDSALELLLPDKLMARDGVAQAMVEDIPEEDWLTHVEILGWMYQYYNAERKIEVDAAVKKGKKVFKDDLAPKTQLFTPEWIVRYMVENSLGRLWMLNNPQSGLRERMEYYIEPDAEHEDFIRIYGPEEITLCDPACGSGHILVYAFDLLYAMYEERGYREREIPQLILQNNLTGLEIDSRAAQISGLALAMCAREHDRRFFGRGVSANISVFKPVAFDDGELPEGCALVKKKSLLDALAHLDEVGSLLTPGEVELAAIREAIAMCENNGGGLFANNAADKLKVALSACERLARKSSCVVANPPYLGSSAFDPFMSKWVKENYPDVKSDLCTCFIERVLSLTDRSGFAGLATSNSWMFLSSYEKLRQKIVNENTIDSLVQLSVHGFHGIAAQVCTFVLRNKHVAGYRGGYVRLNDFDHWTLQEGKTLEAIKNPDCGWFYRRDADTFKQIPGTPIAYWASDAVCTDFSQMGSLSDVAKPRQGLATGDNNRFLREWWEPGKCNLAIWNPGSAKWYPCNKGGSFRKWYGNFEIVINWQEDGAEIKGFQGSVIRNPSYYLREGLTWGTISSSLLSMRYTPKGFIFESKGAMCFAESSTIMKCCLGALNSSPAMRFLSILCPTLDFHEGPVGRVPVADAIDMYTQQDICNIVDGCIATSKDDYDSFETSWDFKRHPLV